MVQRILTSPEPRQWLIRIARRIEPDGDCWLWAGALDKNGYGKFAFGPKHARRYTGAHRASWIAHRGDIPDDMLVVDHLCRNTACVNPWHMELVSNWVNSVERAVFTKKRGRPLIGGDEHGCGKHGREDGYDKMMLSGYVRWVCRPCAKDRIDRYQLRHKDAPP